ncbi:MAG: ABC transporter permease [Oscillospiraceae bacterium]|jgi:peptide/nickel transport system permease protein|nr:ABC transporter permease [Oscillospiraceae bacterium]
MDEKYQDSLKKDAMDASEFSGEVEDVAAKQLFMTPGQIVARQFFRNRLAIVGLVILVIAILFCVVGPFLSPYSETEMFYLGADGQEVPKDVPNYSARISESGARLNKRAEPDSVHLLGTTELGHDMFTRLMYGGRVSLMVGFIVVFVELLLGVTLGGIAGYYGGWIDTIIMRLVEIFNSIPFIPLMLIISSVMINLKIPEGNKIYYTMVIMGVLYWAGVARLVRGQILSLREMEYMQAAEAGGIRGSRKIMRHLIPNVMPQIIVMATMDLGGVILTESTMSYLGIGTSAMFASWGNMVQAVTSDVIMRNAPYLWIPPGLAILFVVLAFNFVGDGLRDAFDPKMKR